MGVGGGGSSETQRRAGRGILESLLMMMLDSKETCSIKHMLQISHIQSQVYITNIAYSYINYMSITVYSYVKYISQISHIRMSIIISQIPYIPIIPEQNDNTNLIKVNDNPQSIIQYI